MTEDNIENILASLKLNGYSALASVFGCGGYLLQKLNRDSQRQAFKNSAQRRNGEWIDIRKNPLDSTKISKAGRLKLIKSDDGYKTVRKEDIGADIMEDVFLNGWLVRDMDFQSVRKNAENKH